MPEARELRTVIEAAEQAASTGDYVTAELSLREAAALQETELGPFHPDLANTLNNLAIVYERIDSPAEAELCYRRAYAIATKAHAPDHPLVVTSRKNLEDFCKARGRPFERSAVGPERVPRRKPAATFSRPLFVGATGALVLAMVLVAAFWFRSSGPKELSSALPEPSPSKSGSQQQEASASAPRDSGRPIARGN